MYTCVCVCGPACVRLFTCVCSHAHLITHTSHTHNTHTHLQHTHLQHTQRTHSTHTHTHTHKHTHTHTHTHTHSRAPSRPPAVLGGERVVRLLGCGRLALLRLGDVQPGRDAVLQRRRRRALRPLLPGARLRSNAAGWCSEEARYPSYAPGMRITLSVAPFERNALFFIRKFWCHVSSLPTQCGTW